MPGEAVILPRSLPAGRRAVAAPGWCGHGRAALGNHAAAAACHRPILKNVPGGARLPPVRGSQPLGGRPAAASPIAHTARTRLAGRRTHHNRGPSFAPAQPGPVRAARRSGRARPRAQCPPELWGSELRCGQRAAGQWRGGGGGGGHCAAIDSGALAGSRCRGRGHVRSSRARSGAGYFFFSLASRLCCQRRRSPVRVRRAPDSALTRGTPP